jgi:hypothetical protein
MQSSPDVTNNVFTGNEAKSGGGLSCWTSFPTVVNNTLCENTADYGGGLWCSYFSQPQITNTIFSKNNGTVGPHIWIGNISIVFISHSDVVGGKSTIHVESGTLNWGSGMIDADPLFEDDGTLDYHLTYPSPCRDAGDNTAFSEPMDFEGDPRIAYGTVDMGSDEFYTHLYWRGDATPGKAVELKFVGLPDTMPVALCIGTGVLDDPIPTPWGDWWNLWWLAFPILGPLDLGSIPSPGGVYVLTSTIPSDFPAPYTIPMQAFVGNSLTNLSTMKVE